MKSERLPWALGWVSLGIGLTELTFPKGLCRLLGASRRHSGLVKVLGIREIASGLGLLTQRHRRPWVWARVAGDAIDLALLAVSFRLPRANRAWHGAITAAFVGVTLVDIYAATAKRPPPLLRADAAMPSLGMEVESRGPSESWRGSGLAEDVGTSAQQGDEGEDEEVKQRKMREAERKLGLPELS
ncbi:hypothetical protein JQX13_49450 [Archangium violaceum]|uniref:hypothetical protein n=1 Tax=Archangium violaceum TaxID=83451 RepID=UPI00193B1D00|nr:hypothetical protein [Archangium violaceum]QRK07914.1 hypothetical protein JQX13_49450 [Archangium violaceum]